MDAMYVMPAVPHPERVIREMERVCAPGGRVIIVNHFAKDNGLRGDLERQLTSFTRLLGWRTDMHLEEILSHTTLSLLSNDSVGLFGLFTLLKLAK